MVDYSNSQGNPAAAIPVYMVGYGVAAGQAFLSYAQVPSLVSVQPLTPPTGARLAVVVPEGGSVRWDIGADPTGDVGMPVSQGQSWTFGASDLSAVRFINATGGTAKLNVAYYGPPS